MTSEDLVGLYSKQLRDAFAHLIQGERPAALVDFPDSANCGDHAVWLGEKTLLSDLGITVAYECSAQSYDRGTMAAKLGTGTILMHGGGHFDGRHPARQELRFRVLKDFPDNKVIVLPQQVTSRDNDSLQRTANAFTEHRDVTVFARSLTAQQMLKRYLGPKARVELAPDLAFMLGPQARSREPLYDIVWIARTDQEPANDRTEAAARLSSQAAEKILLPQFPDGVEINVVVKQRPPTIFLTDWSSLVFENEDARLAYRRLDFDARAQAQISRALHLLSLGRVVITDRLHGHIFCLMLGIPHVLLNDESGKNWEFYETWTRQSSLCRVARNPAEAWSLARDTLPKLKGTDASAPAAQG
jgi:pyruvyl transferase EpsO